MHLLRMNEVRHRVTGVHQGWRILSPDGRELVVQAFGPGGDAATAEELERLRAALVAMLQAPGDVQVEITS